MMAKLTKEQFDKLTPYANALIAAHKSSFVRISTADFNKVAEIYNQVFDPLRKGQMGCNTCRLNALSKLGALYAEFIEGEKEEKKVTKKGRPKKLTEETINDKNTENVRGEA